MPALSHRVGILGAGFQSANLAHAISHTDGLQLAAFAGRNREKTAGLAADFQVPVAVDLDALLDDDSIGLIIIATPNSEHADAVVRVLDAGRSAFVEKPVAIDLDGLGRIVDSARNSPGHLIVGHALRTAPGISRMLRAIQLGAIGEVLGIEAVRTRVLATPALPMSWKQDPTATGGELLHEIHELDLACLVGGKISDVVGFPVAAPNGSVEAPITHSLIRFESGAVAHHVIASGDHNSAWKVTVSGTEASLRADLREGVVTRLESGASVSTWPIFDEPDVNESLVASSSGRASHNRPGKGASPWMASLAQYEMAEVLRILNGAPSSVLLRFPITAAAAALAIVNNEPWGVSASSSLANFEDDLAT